MNYKQSFRTVNQVKQWEMEEKLRKEEAVIIELMDGRVMVVVHNNVDAFSLKTVYWVEEQIKGVIKGLEEQGREVVLVTCMPGSLPEELSKYCFDCESMESWAVMVKKTGVYVQEIDQEEEWWLGSRKRKKERIKEVESKYGEVVKEWWLDVEECKVGKKGELIYMRKYMWAEGKWGMTETYGKETYVTQEAPELGFYKPEPLPR